MDGNGKKRSILARGAGPSHGIGRWETGQYSRGLGLLSGVSGVGGGDSEKSGRWGAFSGPALPTVGVPKPTLSIEESEAPQPRG